MLIDLDVVPAPAPPRERVWPWRRFAAVAAGLLVLLLGGAAAPRRPVVFERVTDTGGRVTAATLLTPEALYTVHDATGDGSVEIVARPLVPGGPFWQARDPMLTADSVQLSRVGSVLVVRDDTTVKIVDVATGRDRWNAEGMFATVLGNRVLTRDDDSDVRLVDMETGRTLWRQRIDLVDAVPDPSGRFLLVMDFAMTLQVRSAADGRLLTSRAVGDEFEFATPTVIGDRVYLLGASTVTALNLADLKTVWVAKPLVLTPLEVTTCGDLLCVRGGSGVSAVDPATGALRWTAPGWVGWSDGVAQRTDGHNAVLDPATGAVVRDLGRGRAGGDLMLRLDGDRTQVTDLRTGRLYGALPGVVPYGCTVAADFLACRVNGDTVVWRVPRA